MKKIYYLPLALAALALTACSSVDDVSDNQGGSQSKYGDQIVFAASIVLPTTRAYTDAASITSYKVAAIDKDNKVYFDYLEPEAPGSGETQWASGRNWIDGMVKFFAYAPTGVTATAVNAANQTISFTQSTTVASQTDLITAYNSGTRSDNPVNLDFKHALSQIVLQATNGNTTDYKVEVSGAKLAFLPNTGTLTFQTASGAVSQSAEWDTTKYPVWSEQSGMEVYESTLTTPVELDETAKAITADNFYMLPQTVSNCWDGTAGTQLVATPADNRAAYFAVKCKIMKGSSVIYNGYSAVALGSSQTWQPGKKYTYTINFFTDGRGGGQIDPIDPTEPGKDIIAPVTFTISISDWVSEEPVNIYTK